jgi:undecaprenyl pyrophosphate synthase
MALPKIQTPLFELNLPSTGQAIKYRPFLVKEQKILLMAMETGETSSILTAVKQIINNCSVEELETEKLPIFDLEYFFLRLRAKSIGEEIDLNLRHPREVNSKGEPCSYVTKGKLNLLDVEVQKSLNHEDKIILDENSGIGVKFKYPTADLAKNFTEVEGKTELDLAAEAIINCIDYIFDKENIYKKEDSTQKELIDFVENLSQEQFQKLSKFFDTMPKLKHEVTWTCPGCGQEEKIELEGLANFFV